MKEQNIAESACKGENNMNKQLINVMVLRHRISEARAKLNKHDFREGRILEGMKAIEDIINDLAKMEGNEMLSWAQKEVELAVASEKKSAEGTKDWQYGVGCYKSAMKAFEALLDNNHSGMSIQLTKSILNRLIDGKCLTPIEDTDDIWNDISNPGVEIKNAKELQCKRMPSLFKKIDKDGKVTYTDIDRVSCIDISNPGVAYHNGLATRLIDKIFPIKMPYLPTLKPYKVYTEEYKDSIAYLYILLPDGQKIDLNRYFKEENGQLVPMEKEEWDARKAAKKAETSKKEENK